MFTVSVSTPIAAPVETVWRILTELDRYAEWNPFIRAASGSLAVGGEVRLHVRSGLGIPLAFRAAILEHTAPHVLRWRGAFGAPWLASGDHWFLVEPVAAGGCQLIQREMFGGVLARLTRRVVVAEAHAGFAAMNRALADRAEHAAGTAATAAG